MATQIVDKNLSDLTSGLGIAQKCAMLEEELASLQATLKKRGGTLFAIGSTMTKSERIRYQERIKEINTLLDRFDRVQKVLDSGLELFWPDKEWYVCPYWESRHFDTLSTDSSVLTNEICSPLPECVLSSFEKAERLAQFDAILMAAPFSNWLFQRDPRSKDPDLVMLGVIIVATDGFIYSAVKGNEKDRKKPRIPYNSYKGIAIFKIDEWQLSASPTLRFYRVLAED